MRNKNDILNNKFYISATYVINFFVTNFWFLMMISPLIIYTFIFENNISMAVVLLISILVGPAITTLLSVMGKLIREGEISPTKDFFHFYKLNFLQSLLVGIILNSVISIAYFDMNYFSSNGNPYLSYLFLIFLILIIMLSLYIYPIISRYNLKIVHLFKMSIRLLIKKIYISITCLAIIIIVLGLIHITRLSLIGVLFGASIICYLIMRMEIKTIDELGEEIKKVYES